jgi:uncharacterized protein (UPF0248 family)
MIGPVNMKISDTIKKEVMGLTERGIPDTSSFHVVFHDDSEIHEKDYNWSDFSEEMIVIFMGQQKRVFLSKHPIKKITINHRGLQTELEPKEGERVYQAIRTISVWMSDKSIRTQHIGRVVGIVDKDGKVIEERFLSEETNEIYGVKV